RDRNVTGVQTCALPISRPVKLLIVKDNRVIFGVFARSAAIANSACDLGKKGDLFVVATEIFWTGDSLISQKSRLARTIKHDLRFDVFALTVQPANGHPAHGAVVGQ